jgi:hypothetical protein
MKEIYRVALVLVSVQPHTPFMLCGSARESSSPPVSNRIESQGISCEVL